MPCDTITQVKTVLEAVNVETFRTALQSLGYLTRQTNNLLQWNGGSLNLTSGVLTTRSDREGQEIRQAYSGEIVKKQAARFGWAVKKTSENKYQIIKRG